MKACMRHPDIDWSDMTTIAAVHSLVVCIEQGVVIYASILLSNST